MPIFLNVKTYRGTAPVAPIGRRFGREGGVVGRGADSDLVLNDPTKYISRAHARVEFRDGDWFLIDIGTNPSLVNGQRLGPAEPAKLTGGELIVIGDYTLVAMLEQESEQVHEYDPGQQMTTSAYSVLASPAPPALAPSAPTGNLRATATIVKRTGPLPGGFDASFDPLGLSLEPPAVPRADAWRGASNDSLMPRDELSPTPAIPHDYDPLVDLLARSEIAQGPPIISVRKNGSVQSILIKLDDVDAAHRELLLGRIRRLLRESGVQATVVSTPSGLEHVASNTGARDRALARGEQRLLGWIDDGVLVDGATLEKAWGLTRQGIDQARRRGELFSLWIKRQHWYPSEFLKFERVALARLNQALGDIDPSDKLLFLLRTHGALLGKSPADAAGNNQLEAVLRIAETWRYA